jgi:transposase-like protein
VKSCSVLGCHLGVLARGLCDAHYHRAYHTGALGEHPRTRIRLSPRQVQQIRAASARGVSQGALARRYGCSQQGIRWVLREDTHTGTRRHKLTADQEAEIVRRYRAGGVRYVDLASDYGVNRMTISRILIRSTQEDAR